MSSVGHVGAHAMEYGAGGVGGAGGAGATAAALSLMHALPLHYLPPAAPDPRPWDHAPPAQPQPHADKQVMPTMNSTTGWLMQSAAQVDLSGQPLLQKFDDLCL